MTDEDPVSETRECGDDVAAYVLGALTPDEADAFRRHMADCVVCRDEVATFQGVADALPMAAPQQSLPRGLRRRVRRRVRAEAKAAREQSRPSRALFAAGAGRRVAVAAFAALAVAAIAVVGLDLGGGSGGARVIAARVSGSPGSAELRLHAGQGQLVIHDMAPPPAGDIYEVWLKRRGQEPAPTTALFSVTTRGTATVAVPGDLNGVDEVLVTPEADGGSMHPTHAPVIVAQLS